MKHATFITLRIQYKVTSKRRIVMQGSAKQHAKKLDIIKQIRIKHEIGQASSSLKRTAFTGENSELLLRGGVPRDVGSDVLL